MSREPPESRAHLIVVVSVVAPCITTVFIAARIWTRAFLLRSLGWDDYISLITLPFVIAFSVVLVHATQYGMGSHVWDLDDMMATSYYEWVAIQSTIYVFCVLGYKLVILFLYLRLFSIDGRLRYATYAVMFWVVGYLLCNFITQVAGCTPISKFWSPATPGHCYDFFKADLVFGSMNWITDLVIFALPWPIVWNMQLSRRERIGVYLVFMSGAVVLELNTGLICSSAAVLKPFINHLLVRTTDQPRSVKYYFERHPSASSNPSTISRTRIHSSPDLTFEAVPRTDLEKTVSIVHERTANFRPGHKREDSASATAANPNERPSSEAETAADYSQDDEC
ncbi:hypothetical protein MMC26_001849 [Xylographa opegraphella]|nr:hypothetical protein [Xylographa opegraphella]